MPSPASVCAARRLHLTRSTRPLQSSSWAAGVRSPPPPTRTTLPPPSRRQQGAAALRPRTALAAVARCIPATRNIPDCRSVTLSSLSPSPRPLNSPPRMGLCARWPPQRGPRASRLRPPDAASWCAVAAGLHGPPRLMGARPSRWMAAAAPVRTTHGVAGKQLSPPRSPRLQERRQVRGSRGRRRRGGNKTVTNLITIHGTNRRNYSTKYKG